MEGYLASIIGFGSNFAPRAWATCSGQLLPIAQNTALFSLLGTIYGGDGRTTFALPDLRGRAPISAGTGPGLSTYREGQRGGVETVTLTVSQIPSHNHVVYPGYSNTPGQVSPANHYPANLGAPNAVYGATKSGNMGAATVGNTGGSQWHTNMQPYLTIYWIICTQGLFPSRS